MNGLVISMLVACCSIALTTSIPYAGCGCIGMRSRISAICKTDFVIRARALAKVQTTGSDDYSILRQVNVLDIIHLTSSTRNFTGQTAQEVVQQGLVEMPTGRCGFPLNYGKKYLISGFLQLSSRSVNGTEWVMSSGNCEYAEKVNNEVMSNRVDEFNRLMAETDMC